MTLRRSCIAIATLLLPGLALAAGGIGAVLKGSPLEHFSEADYQQFLATAQQAADGLLGKSIDWSTGEDGAHGTVKAVAAFERDGATCRELRGQVAARGKRDPFRITVCKAGEGGWRLASNRPRKKSIPTPPARETAR